MIVMRLVGVEYVHKVYEYCEPYYAEIAGAAGAVPCPETAMETFSSALHYEDDYAVFVVLDDGKIRGMCIVIKGRSFFKGHEADIDFMYLRPDDRGTGASRMLVEACRDWADENNITILYGGCATFLGMQNNQKYVNLYKKFGFKELGSIVCYVGDK